MAFIPGRSKAELSLSSSSLKEGDTLTTTVATSNVKPGTTLFWQIDGNGIDASDFDKGSLSGSGVVSRTGSFSFSHALSADGRNEGKEQLTIGLFTDSSLTNGVAKTAVAIADATSSSITIKSRNTITEGKTLLSTGKATGLTGSTIFLASQGINITNHDFAKNSHIAKAKIGANGKFKIKQFINKDLLTEGPETLVIQAFKDSKLTQLLGSSNPITIADTSKQTSYPGNWSTIGKNSVFHRGFNVLTPGPVTIIVDGQAGQSVQASLYGSSNYGKGQIKPVAQKTNPAGNIEFTFNITTQHLKHGNNYRLGIAGGPQNNQGSYEIRLPEKQGLINTFLKQRVRLGTGDVWRTATEQKDFYQDLLASSKGLSSVLGTRISCVDTHKFKLFNVQELSCLGSRTKTGLLTPGDAENVTDNGFKDYLYPLPPELKINQDILAKNHIKFETANENGAKANSLVNSKNRLEIQLQISSKNEVELAKKKLKGLGYLSTQLTEDTLVIEKDKKGKPGVNYKDLLKIAEIPEIVFVGNNNKLSTPINSSERTRHNANVAQTEDWNGNGLLNANEDLNGNGILDTNLGLSGLGIVVGVKDSNVINHPDFQMVFDQPGSSIFTGSDHGVHVAGIIAANGNDGLNGASIDPARAERGHAPAASIFDFHSSTGSSTSNYDKEEIEQITDNSISLLNRSQAFDLDFAYGQGRLVDQLVAKEAGINKPILHVTASANNGSGSQYGHIWGFFSNLNNPKNSLIVGALFTDQQLRSSSSKGPVFDGSMKPNIVADGASVTSTGFDGNDQGGTGSAQYESKSGTSMASPAVAGSAALLYEAYYSQYLEQYGHNLDDQAPLPATIKSILLNSAVDIRGPQNSSDELVDDADVAGQTEMSTFGPDYLTGYGRIDVGASVELMQQSRANSEGINAPTGFRQGSLKDRDIVEFQFAVSEDWINSRPNETTIVNGSRQDIEHALKITLAWDDPASDANNAASDQTKLINGPDDTVTRLLINDLDVELIDPNGNVHYPWQLGHTITDGSGNNISPEDQVPGTEIQISIPERPVDNPLDRCASCGGNPRGNGSAEDTAGTDYEKINVDIFDGDDGIDDPNDGGWVAQRGRDHLNNVEQVAVQKSDLTPGHWTVRISGFDIPDGPQTYAVAGMPDPDLPDLKVQPLTRIALDENGGLHDFSWQALNLGDVNAPASDYKIYLSDDITVDAGDVELFDINNLAQNLPAINVGNNSGQIDSRVNITNAQASALLGGGSTVSDLIDQDTFLLVQADPDDNILEYAELNTAAMQVARQIDVVLVLDRSGSMNNTVTASNGRSKVELMRESAGLFLDMLRVDANDRFAGIEFNDNADLLFASTTNSLYPITTSRVNSAKTAVDGLSPNGATDIHEALSDAHDLLTAGGNNRPKTIVFLSDGVSTAGQDPTNILPDLSSDDVKVFSVGFGNNGSNDIDVDLLSELADQTDGGFWQYAQNGLSLDKFFVNAVAGAIGDDVIIDPVGELKKGKSTSIDVPLSSASGTVRFILTTDEDKASKTLNFSLKTPSGLSINSSNATSFDGINYISGGPGYQVYDVELPLEGIAEEDQSGDWEMVISNPASTNTTIGYTASAIGQTQLHLSLDAAAQASVVQSNQPLIAGLKLHSNGENIAFMDASVTIKGFQKTLAQVVKQATGFNSIKDYVDNKGASLRQAKKANNGELRTDENIADHLLSKDHPKLYKSLRTYQDLQTIDLTSNKQRINGATRFKQKLTNLDLNPGAYELIYTVNGRLDDCTPFTRELTHSVFLKPKDYKRPDILEPGNGDGQTPDTPDTPDIPDVVIPDFDGGIIDSQPGSVTLEGSNDAEAFTFGGNSDLGSDGADTITNFNPRKDILGFERESFGNLGNRKGKVKVKTTKTANKKLDQLLQSNNDFVFIKTTGELYFNENGREPGSGKDGGLLAILEGNKQLNSSNFELF